MNYHVIINGCSSSYEEKAREIQYFIKENLSGQSEGLTFIICNKENDKNFLISFAPTNKIIFILVSYYQPEIVLQELEKHMNKDDIYIFGSDYSAKELVVRLAARVNGSSMVSVNKAVIHDNCFTVCKKVYSNQMQGSFLMEKAPFCMSIEKGMGQYAMECHKYQVVKEIDISSNAASHVTLHKIDEVVQLKGIENAEFIVAAGRGVKSKQKVLRLKEMADLMNGELGVSRAVAMNAWASMSRLIGVSGGMLKPKLCITAGVSGAAAFYAGIEKSDFIIAINTDENAPIMKKADVIIVDDYESVLEALTSLISGDKKEVYNGKR